MLLSSTMGASFIFLDKVSVETTILSFLIFAIAINLSPTLRLRLLINSPAHEVDEINLTNIEGINLFFLTNKVSPTLIPSVLANCT